MRTSGHRAARAGPTCAFVLRVTVAVLVVALWCAGRTLGSGDGDGRDSQHAHVDVSAALHDDPASAATPHYLWAIPADTAARGEEGVGVPSDVDPVAAASAAAAAEAVAEAGGAAGVGVPAGNTGVARHGGGSVDGSHATQAAFKLRIPNRVKGWFQYLVNAQVNAAAVPSSCPHPDPRPSFTPTPLAPSRRPPRPTSSVVDWTTPLTTTSARWTGTGCLHRTHKQCTWRWVGSW